jgi:cephalosporin hydroxylase
VNAYQCFLEECREEIALQGNDAALKELTSRWIIKANTHKYSYHYEWCGRPIIQYPQDIVAMQELIWAVKPTLIVETGIAHGGSLIFSASMLALLDLCDRGAPSAARRLGQSGRKVLGVDIDIRSHNRAAIEAHPLISYIDMIEGSSVAPDVIAQVKTIARQHESVMVCLDSNHSHAHVLAELEAYGSLVTAGSYCVVFDTIVEKFPPESCEGRPWGPGNSPRTAVREYLKSHPELQIDRQIQDKLLITVAPDGYLRRSTAG